MLQTLHRLASHYRSRKFYCALAGSNWVVVSPNETLNPIASSISVSDLARLVEDGKVIANLRLLMATRYPLDSTVNYQQYVTLELIDGIEGDNQREIGILRQPHKVLFVSADPSDTTRLGIQREFSKIQEELHRSIGRDGFNFEICLAARPSDLSRMLLLKPRPRFLHFSGHGTHAGAICLENDVGLAQAVSGAALGSLIEPVSKELHCVLLNACYASKQVDTILTHIPFVIGMRDSIGDRAAIAYSIGFYQAIFSGEEVPIAHRLGCAQVHMISEGEHETPVLLKAS